LVYVLAFALVRIELLLDSRLRFRLAAQGLMCWELHIAEFADSQHWNVVSAPDDPEFSLCHAPSLRRSFWRSREEKFKLYHYRWRVL
jgi:hypothetical protein